MGKNKRRRFEQSTIEYLTTYLWVFVLLLMVFVTFFYLGIFNGSGIKSYAKAGSCYVIRPSGPFTTSFAKLAGSCNSALPQYVAYFKQRPISNLTINMPVMNVNAFEVSYWIQFNNSVPYNVKGAYVWGNAMVNGVKTTWGTAFYPFPVFRAPMVLLSIVFNATSGNVLVYHNATLFSGPSTIFVPVGNDYFVGNQIFTIGGVGCCGLGNVLNAQIADVQLYDTALTQNQLTTLYREGPGGAPVSIPNLLGWWPLNGNANDYSGNNQNIFLVNISYTQVYSYVPQTSP